MTWYASSDNQTAAEATHLETVTLVDLDFPSGHVRLHTRTGTFSYGGNDYLGVGKFGGIGEVEEDAELRPAGLTLTLSGVDSALVTTAITEKCHGRDVAVYKGFLNTSTMALIADPEVAFRGLIDFLQVDLGQNSGSIIVQCENELARWQRHSNTLYTSESQKAVYPADEGFDQLKNSIVRTIDWSKTGSPLGYTGSLRLNGMFNR